MLISTKIPRTQLRKVKKKILMTTQKMKTKPKMRRKLRKRRKERKQTRLTLARLRSRKTRLQLTKEARRTMMFTVTQTRVRPVF